MTLEKIQNTIRKFRMIKEGDRVLVALSGGPDSVCLLHALQALSAALRITLHAAHLDHQFRGSESAAEAQFAARLSEQLGVPCTVDACDVPAYCRERGLSAQAGAREARYRFLQQVADETGSTRIALGHTASDQAETLLMRLIRGAGIPALSGIPPVRDGIIRPLIEMSREEVMGYLGAHALAFVADPSNASGAYTRNRVRRDILPVLEAFNPRIVHTLATEAELLRDENEALEALLSTAAADVLTQEKGNAILDRSVFEQLLPALKRRVLRAAISAAGADPAHFSSVQVEEALRFLSAAQTGRTMRLPAGLELSREYGRFILHAAREPLEVCVELIVPGTTMVPGLDVSVEIRIEDGPEPGGSGNYRWQALFDYDKIGLPLYIRNRRRGDRFVPAGMHGRSKKLQDYLVDEKVPREKRDLLPIVATRNDLLWVVGMRTDERFLAGPGTKRALIVTMRNAL